MPCISFGYVSQTAIMEILQKNGFILYGYNNYGCNFITPSGNETGFLYSKDLVSESNNIYWVTIFNLADEDMKYITNIPEYSHIIKPGELKSYERYIMGFPSNKRFREDNDNIMYINTKKSKTENNFEEFYMVNNDDLIN